MRCVPYVLGSESSQPARRPGVRGTLRVVVPQGSLHATDFASTVKATVCDVLGLTKPQSTPNQKLNVSAMRASGGVLPGRSPAHRSFGILHESQARLVKGPTSSFAIVAPHRVTVVCQDATCVEPLALEPDNVLSSSRLPTSITDRYKIGVQAVSVGFPVR